MEKSIDEEMMIFLQGESSDENENDENNHQSFLKVIWLAIICFFYLLV